ncbi:MAG: type I-E CRISPR-associated protein Cse1/CasA [Sedimenticola sp.]
MNLIEAQWIPVRRKSGESRIAPWQISEPDDPVLELAAPRPDFNGALLQFLIGLLQTACPPEDGNQWADWLEEPPSPETLREKFKSFASAFELDGDSPRFMQDLGALDNEKDPKPISALLIDAPGEITIKENRDHFVKRGHCNAICPACVATALYTLQTHTSGVGAGNRACIRGVGPLTTLITLDPEGSKLSESLWRNLWLNVIENQAPAFLGEIKCPDSKSDVFPWLAPTRTSESTTGQETTPLDTHPLQMYWAMPRRIQVEWSNTVSGHCELCGDVSDSLITHYRAQNYGIQYTGAWEHPLTPHFISTTSSPKPIRASVETLTYTHWAQHVLGNKKVRPAIIVRKFHSKKLQEEQLRIRAFGYEMDKKLVAKARCWQETTFPLYTLKPAISVAFTARTETVIQAATDAASMIRSCIKEAWFKRPGDAKGDTSFLKEAFFNHTEKDFYTSLKELQILLEAGEDGKEILHTWHKALTQSSLSLFDYWTTRGDFGAVNPRRIAQAHQKLIDWIYGNKKYKNTGLPSVLGIQLSKENTA